MLANRLSTEGGEHEAVCQQECWAPNGVDLGGPTSIGEGNESQRGHWAPKGGGIVRSHIGWGEERNIFYKGVENSP